ncbi:MAG: FG-GAP-like repeat-containing protein [Pirellulales bacterium]
MTGPPSTSTQHRSPGGKRLALAAVGLVGAALAAWNFWPSTSSVDVLVRKGNDWLLAGDHEQAGKLAARALSQNPSSNDALLLAGQAALGTEQFAAAAAYFNRIPPSDPRFSDAQCSAGDAWSKLGHSQQAEASYLRAQAAQPDSVQAAGRLADLYSIEGRSWESRPPLTTLLKDGNASFTELVALAHAERFAGPRAELERFAAHSPDDAAPLVGLAILEYRASHAAEAERLLRQAVAIDAGTLQGQAQLGWIIALRNDDTAWRAWHAACPESVFAHPLAWTVRGMWLDEHGQTAAALRCFLEAAARDPDALVAHLRAAQSLASLGQDAAAEVFQQRAADLLVLQQTAEVLMRDPLQRATAINNMAAAMHRLGRFREAIAWYELLVREQPSHSAARQALQTLRAASPLDPPRHLAGPLAVQPLVRLDDFPLPQAASFTVSAGTRPASTDQQHVTFADQAEQAGIDFRYYADNAAQRPERFLRDTLGGGVATFDYDGDGWPDLYFAQGGDWSANARLTAWRDRLYRNVAAAAVDVTQSAGLGDDRYSGGVAAGDLDNDGFADLYVANLGVNRLYRNNGDGTFQDITEESGIGQFDWTVSCLLADLNGDSIPDLYDATYAGGDAQERSCQPLACAPRVFPALQDRLWLASGDGRFHECGQSAGIHAVDGLGLGVLAADMEGAGRLSLFVANDQTPNYWFVNQTPRAGGPPRFVDRGVLAGLAVDGGGRPQACMGIAAADADGDGTLDLFVTNFEQEPNTLYLNQGDGETFADATARAGLREPSLPMLAFGTQFLDADLDGRPDLLVTNGHVHDMRPQGGVFQMRPQFFQNLGQGRFVELPAEALGPFFIGNYLGRGLARLDWNRDGREDAAISHIDAPAALLANTTQTAGHFLALQFRGVQSARDPIGVTVRVTAGGRVRFAQLTAGDGYMASNQRQLVFGLGSLTQAEEITVRWPSGHLQTFGNTPADTAWILVEGSQELVTQPAR